MTMTNVERFLKCMNYEPVDHPPLVLSGGWPDTMARWHREGLPEGMSLHEYFEVEPFGFKIPGVKTRFVPEFEPQVLEETDRYVIRRDAHGVKVQQLKSESASGAAHYLEYPVKGRQDMTWLAERLDPHHPGRFPADLDRQLAELQGHPTQAGLLDFGSFFGQLHESAGTEATCLLFYDDPGFVHWFNERIADCCLAVMKRVLPHPAIRVMGGHEDMGYKNASIISPAMFREFMKPYYEKTVGYARSQGQWLFVMDSDGDCRELIPLWLELGVNCMTPNEVAANQDVVELRRRFGRDLRLMGGLDKRAFAKSKRAIREEVMRKVPPLIEEGGYVPGVDHGVPPDVPWEHYCYWVQLMKEIYGIK